MGFTPFRLLFGTKAMTLEEIKNESMRVLNAKEIEEVDEKVEKYMIEITILEAAENIKKYQKDTKAWKDRKVVRKDIKTGDLVLNRKKNWENPGKFQESWEGPYIAKETNIPGVFRLLSQTGEELPYSWNVDSLKRYYPCIPKLARFIFQHFVFFVSLHSVKIQKKPEPQVYKWFRKQKHLLFSQFP
jgi:hypothetical protein